jgi:phosphoribosylformimino-5-aminoimidazole carboxamide ribotide isomerase
MCSPVKRDYNTKIIYNENPLEVAKEFEAHGIEYLHLVDLDGASRQAKL